MLYSKYIYVRVRMHIYISNLNYINIKHFKIEILLKLSRACKFSSSCTCVFMKIEHKILKLKYYTQILRDFLQDWKRSMDIFKDILYIYIN